MKTLVILATLAALTATASASGRPTKHEPGGPVRQGDFCWVSTDMHGSGWWDTCDPESIVPRGRSQHGIYIGNGIENGSGGGGGGGGGH